MITNALNKKLNWLEKNKTDLLKKHKETIIDFVIDYIDECDIVAGSDYNNKLAYDYLKMELDLEYYVDFDKLNARELQALVDDIYEWITDYNNGNISDDNGKIKDVETLKKYMESVL